MTGPLTPLAVLLVGGAVLAGTAGALALRVLHRRGDRWPAARTLAGAAGLASVAAAGLLPVLGGPAGFVGHVAVHLLLGMVAPLLLVLGAPVTLALRTAPRPARVALLAAVHSRAARVLTAPATALLLDVGALYGLYLTGLHSNLHHLPVFAAAVHLHMLAAGTLFAAVVAGADPLPSRPGTAGRLVLLVVAGAAHDVLAVTLYAHGLGDGTGPTPDVERGAALMRTGGHVVELGLAAAVMATWYRQGGRELAHERRRSQGVERVGAPPHLSTLPTPRRTWTSRT